MAERRDKMKNNKNYILILSFIFLLLPCSILASEVEEEKTNIPAYITQGNLVITKEPNIDMTGKGCLYQVNGKYDSNYAAPGALHCLDLGDEVKIKNYNNPVESTIDSCKSHFLEVTFITTKSGAVTGYVCADAVKTDVDTSKYAEEFTKAGFPESYFERLTLLKDAHPNWIFTAFQTNLDWNESVQNESIVGMSYIQITDLEKGTKYISLEEGSYDPINQKYIVKEPNNWYAANAQTVAYYLDPRNFLAEKEIFMFENLSYNSNYQTLEVVQNVLKNTDLYPYAETYIEAATYNGNSINPVHLAASSKQEVVLSDGKLSGSANGTNKINDVAYYNVYNLGANSSCANPVACAINFASGYIATESETTSFNRPWTTIELSIKNGASYIAESYINKKQNTLYFKKWNVTSNYAGNYSHQYMTNIQAPMSEGKSTYEAYSKIDGLLDSAIEFLIPVYQNMPDTPSLLPAIEDEETKDKIDEEAKEEEENRVSSITNIIESSPYSYNNDYISKIKLGTSAQALIANIKGNNQDISVTVTRSVNNQTIELKDGTALGTGDVVTVSNGQESKAFRIVIYGDVNGDGKVSAVDYVQVKNCIMASSTLTGAYKLAADVNQDGTISAVDYVNIKNYIMNGNSVIE